ncbi:MAG: hypothetical protein CVV57_01675 [Tenericutes bacterium HGW-Tenericutes-2]|nr:MAG: hypothetical protein CVV57_01675 [Tenericutes bacterium HGW-Tenericutes-2]
MMNIKGITYKIHHFSSHKETHYFGYDANSIMIMSSDSINDILKFPMIDQFEYHHNRETSITVDNFEKFINHLLTKLHILNWNEFYCDQDVLDGQSWEVILHYDSGKTKSFEGVNAYPENFNHFIRVCKKYNFGI